MAWTDAARAAALEARRAHAKAKSSFVRGGGPSFALSATNAKLARSRGAIARGLKAVRAGALPASFAKSLSKDAVRATAYRNAARSATAFALPRVHIPGYAAGLVKAYSNLQARRKK